MPLHGSPVVAARPGMTHGWSGHEQGDFSRRQQAGITGVRIQCCGMIEIPSPESGEVTTALQRRDAMSSANTTASPARKPQGGLTPASRESRLSGLLTKINVK